MEHQTDKKANRGFLVKDFVKPTARNRTFLNGRSHHPIHIFKSIITGEAKRMRRLNENQEQYASSLDRLQKKCDLSNFDPKITEELINKAKQWTFTTHQPKVKDSEIKQRTVWPTQFHKRIKLNNLEKKLAPNASIVYCRPPTLANMLLNYKSISQPRHNNDNNNFSSPKCNRCGLCGNYGVLKNMVIDKKKFLTKFGNTIILKNKLNCKNYGIYGAECKICKELYVGQTKNKYSTRWSSHRTKWNKLKLANNQKEAKDTSNQDDAALITHYRKYHKDISIKELDIADAFGVFFIEQPKPHALDIKENYWISKMMASINIAKTFLPKFK